MPVGWLSGRDRVPYLTGGPAEWLWEHYCERATRVAPPEPEDEEERLTWEFFGREAMQRSRALDRLSEAPPVSALAGARLRERVVVRLQRAWGYGRGVGSQFKFWTTGVNTSRELLHASRVNENGKREYVCWKRGTNSEKQREAANWWRAHVGKPESDAPGKEIEEGAMTLISPILWRAFLLDASAKPEITDEDLDEATMHLARAFEVILRPWLDNDNMRLRPKNMTTLCRLIEGRETIDSTDGIKVGLADQQRAVP